MPSPPRAPTASGCGSAACEHDWRSEIGRHRRLDALSGSRGVFAVAAIDHRDALTAAHAKAGLPKPTREQVLQFKATVIQALAPHATGVMLDPEAGALALSIGAPGPGPVVMPLEAQGYSDVEAGRVTTFLPGWSPARAAESGASACKLLLPYRPDHEASAVLQHAVVEEAVAGCRAAGLPLILEPIAYPLPSEDASTLPGRLGPLVLATVERLRPLGADILKLQFPRDADAAAEVGVVQEDRRGLRRHAVGAARRRGRLGRLRARRRGRVRGRGIGLHRRTHALAGGARARGRAARGPARRGVRAARAAPARARRGARPAVAASAHRERGAAGRLVER